MLASNQRVPRHWQRHKIDLRVRLVFAAVGGSERSCYARANDLSEGGMSVFAPIEMDMGRRLEIEIILPISRNPMRLEAVVRNRDGYRYGLEFLTLGPTQRHEITRLCDAAALMAVE